MRPTERAAGSALCGLLAACVLLSGCGGHRFEAQAPPARFLSGTGPVAACAAHFGHLDAAVEAAGVADGQAARVPGFPYLRVTRLLAAVRPDEADRAAFDFWQERLRSLGRTGRSIEIANLPPALRRGLPADFDQTLDTCEGLLAATDAVDASTRRRLTGAAVVPDEYRLALRVAGLYPLAALPFRAGVVALHERLAAGASTGSDGDVTRYRPATSRRLPPASVARILERSAANPLGIPIPGAGDLDRLFETHAPVWELVVASGDDRIVAPVRVPGGGIGVGDDPVTYVLPSWTRFGGAVLLQLNYVVWFPARTADGAIDVLAGFLDGLTWRVTLGRDGHALVHDSMHNCGCYHVFMPSARLRPRPGGSLAEEPILVMPGTPPGTSGAVVRLAPGTHYVESARAGGDEPARAYRMEPYDRLRSLPAPGGARRSLFRPDGIVPGTERLERYLFWPMGVPEPGAMRQWGRHATAFVGRRHFDDPDLIGRYFESVPGP